MTNRQPNQFRILKHERDLSEGAEELLSLVEKYQYTFNVTTEQYASLMGVQRRNIVKYLNELVDKGYLSITPENRKAGQGKANTYKILDNYWPGKFDETD